MLGCSLCRHYGNFNQVGYCVNVCVGVILSFSKKTYIYITPKGVALRHLLPAVCSACSTKRPPSHHTSNSWGLRWTTVFPTSPLPPPPHGAVRQTPLSAPSEAPLQLLGPRQTAALSTD